MVTLGASLLALVVVRRKQGPAVTPLTQSNPDLGEIRPGLRGRWFQLIADIRRRAATISFRPRFGWKRSDGSGAGYIDPFEYQEGSVVFEGKNHRPPESYPVRRDSVAATEVTLVARPSVGSGTSVSVQVSALSSEKERIIWV